MKIFGVRLCLLHVGCCSSARNMLCPSALWFLSNMSWDKSVEGKNKRRHFSPSDDCSRNVFAFKWMAEIIAFAVVFCALKLDTEFFYYQLSSCRTSFRRQISSVIRRYPPQIPESIATGRTPCMISKTMLSMHEIDFWHKYSCELLGW